MIACPFPWFIPYSDRLSLSKQLPVIIYVLSAIYMYVYRRLPLCSHTISDFLLSISYHSVLHCSIPLVRPSSYVIVFVITIPYSCFSPCAVIFLVCFVRLRRVDVWRMLSEICGCCERLADEKRFADIVSDWRSGRLGTSGSGRQDGGGLFEGVF